MDAVHVTRSGFGSRYPYADFIQRYGFCAPLAGGEGQQARSSDILRLLGLDASMYRLALNSPFPLPLLPFPHRCFLVSSSPPRLGHTKLFLRHNVIEVLETRRSEILSVFSEAAPPAPPSTSVHSMPRWEIQRSPSETLTTRTEATSAATRCVGALFMRGLTSFTCSPQHPVRLEATLLQSQAAPSARAVGHSAQ